MTEDNKYEDMLKEARQWESRLLGLLLTAEGERDEARMLCCELMALHYQYGLTKRDYARNAGWGYLFDNTAATGRPI